MGVPKPPIADVGAEPPDTLGELAAGLAHDILNPLAGIAGAVDILSYELGPDHSRREILQQMRREVARVQDLLSDLMEYAGPRPCKW